MSARRLIALDAAALLNLFVLLISLVPSNLILPGMTDLGRPGLLIGFLLFAWWVLIRFSPDLAVTQPQPLRWTFLVFMVTLLISYAIGFMRGPTTMEANSADRTLIFFCIFTGIALTAADGISSWDRLYSLLRVLIFSAMGVAIIAIVQYVLRIDITRYLTLPGLQVKGWSPGFEARGSAMRVASTTEHYIEMAAYLALALPFAIHFAAFGRGRLRRLSTLAAATIAVGVMTAVSRTGLLAVGIVLAVLFTVWTWRMRYTMAVALAGLLAASAATGPGLLRTLLHLFDNTDSDTSILARQERYPLVFHYVAQRPWFGRGTGTWVPPQYQILDNQWLATLIANGIVGVAALAAVHLTGIVLAWLALRRSPTAEGRHLCAALIATQLVGLVVAGTFDSLGFLTYATILALTVGLCGTVWRLSALSPLSTSESRDAPRVTTPG